MCALALFDRAGRNRADRRPASQSVSHVDLPRHSRPFPELIRAGLSWLFEHQNDDGGWGDTVDSPSNISTTALCWAALGVAGNHNPPVTADAQTARGAVERAEVWLKRRAGDLTPPCLAHAISTAYGEDRTFSAPILTMCALAGRFGAGSEAWRCIPALPFELAACPHKWFRRLGLPVVSYALPALIAVGQARHHHRPTRNPITRCLRHLTSKRTLGILQSIQPPAGGFLEAPPLTSFVAMSLVSMGLTDHPVVDRAVGFLAASAREDGSWPIDTSLATWVTTLSVNALAGGRDPGACSSIDRSAALRRWLLGQQYDKEHPYTHAAPGGWAWNALSGGVPDADDTSGALLALRHLANAKKPDDFVDDEIRRAVSNAVRWLLDLQNSDGGVPTFCRGWGKLPFDRSSPDLTAHTLRAWTAWHDFVPLGSRRRVERATLAAIRYLVKTQREDGSWVPLWFGNQTAPNQENPLYGTTRVLLAAEVVPVDRLVRDAWPRACGRAVVWVLSAQNHDGGWGGAASVPSSIEETALAVEALAYLVGNRETRSCHLANGAATLSIADRAGGKPLVEAIRRGSAWLIKHTDGGTRFKPAPIGLYFAKLWYSERLYPLIYMVSALERVGRLQAGAEPTSRHLPSIEPQAAIEPG